MAWEPATGTVLVVDDDAYIREMLTELLEDEGYQVAGAANGHDALIYLSNVDMLPKLILLDLNMPVMSGWEFRAVQMQDVRLAAIPVVVISASGSEQALAQRLAAEDYLAKPLNFNKLLTLVAYYDQQPAIGAIGGSARAAAIAARNSSR